MPVGQRTLDHNAECSAQCPRPAGADGHCLGLLREPARRDVARGGGRHRAATRERGRYELRLRLPGIGGLTAMAPERRREIVGLRMKSIVGGTLATLSTGAVVASLRL